MENISTTQVIQLLQGLKPYLGPNGESADKVINVLQFITSPQAQEFIQNLSQLIPQKKFFHRKTAVQKPPAEINLPVESKPLQPATAFLGNFGFIFFLIVLFLLWSDF